MIWYWLFIVLGWAFFRGIGEGITFHFPNPREHPWFGGYHWFRSFEAGLLIAAAVMYAEIALQRIYVLGIAILCWEVFELAYLIARLGQANWHENILGFYAVNGVGIVLALHMVRTLAGGLLIWRGSDTDRNMGIAKTSQK